MAPPLPVVTALLSGAALLVWFLAHARAGQRARPPLEVAAAFKALRAHACKPAAGAGVDAAAGSRAAKLAAYEWEMDMRLQHLLQHKEAVSMTDMWVLMAPLWSCDGPLERIGWFLDGGKWMCDANRTLARKPCTVLSMGSNGQTDFESAILQRAPHCKVHTYDHSLTPQLKTTVSSVPGLQFHPTGITSEVMLEAMRRGDVESAPYTAENFTTVLGALAAAGSDWVDVLKVDIEGSEWPVFHELLNMSNSSIPATQVLIELHPLRLAMYPALYPGSMVQSVAFFFEGMRRQGFKGFANEPNLHSGDPVHHIEYSFVKVDQRGRVVHRRSSKER